MVKKRVVGEFNVIPMADNSNVPPDARIILNKGCPDI